MKQAEFQEIAKLLRIYPGCCREKGEIDAWWNTLKDYDYNKIRDATENYIRSETRIPVPASIIGRVMKNAPKGNLSPHYENINGKIMRVYQCQRCHDTGIVTWENKEQRVIGRPCLCEAGRNNYRWGFLTKGEKEEYIKRKGYHGEDMDYDVPALWAKDGIYE